MEYEGDAKRCLGEWVSQKGNNLGKTKVGKGREPWWARTGSQGRENRIVRRWFWGIPKGEMLKGSQGGHRGVLFGN